MVVLALSDGSQLAPGTMTTSPGSQQRELDELAASGARVFVRVPEAATLDELMSPTAVPKAMAMGARQAEPTPTSSLRSGTDAGPRRASGPTSPRSAPEGPPGRRSTEPRPPNGAGIAGYDKWLGAAHLG